MPYPDFFAYLGRIVIRLLPSCSSAQRLRFTRLTLRSIRHFWPGQRGKMPLSTAGGGYLKAVLPFRLVDSTERNQAVLSK